MNGWGDSNLVGGKTRISSSAMGLLLVVAVGVVTAGVRAYEAWTDRVEFYEYRLDSGELSAFGVMRWDVGAESSSAWIQLRVDGETETWEYELQHDADGRVVVWSATHGERAAEWRYDGGRCTLVTPEGEESTEDCEPLRHPLLQVVDCWRADCAYSAPNPAFTGFEQREWRRGAAYPEGAAASAGEMRAVSGSNGEVWWYATGDHSPDYITMPGGLVWARAAARPLPEALRQAPPLSVTGDGPPLAREAAPAADVGEGADTLDGAEEGSGAPLTPEFTVSGPPLGETMATEFELSGPGVASIEQSALNSGRQMGFRTRDGTVRVSMREEVASTPLADTEAAASQSAVAARIVAEVHNEIEPRRTAARVTAAAVADRGYGDCTDMAVLAVARLQEQGIHARVVAGVAYVDGWGLHAWVEFEERGPAGTTWRTADPTTGEVPAPADRIRLAVALDDMQRLSGEIRLRSL